MGEPYITLSYWLLRLAALGFILRQGLRLKLYRSYPWVFVHVIASLVVEGGVWVLYFTVGAGTYLYAYSFVFAHLALVGISMVIVLQIYFLMSRFRRRVDWHLVVVPFLLVLAEIFGSREIWVYYRVIGVAQTTLVYFGLAALVRRVFCRQVSLGWNLSMVLLAYTLPGTLYAIAFAGDNSSSAFFDKDLLIKLTSVGFTVVLAVGMTEHSPPRLVSAAPRLAFAESSVRMWRSVKLLWNLLRS